MYTSTSTRHLIIGTLAGNDSGLHRFVQFTVGQRSIPDHRVTTRLLGRGERSQPDCSISVSLCRRGCVDHGTDVAGHPGQVPIIAQDSGDHGMIAQLGGPLRVRSNQARDVAGNIIQNPI